MKRVISQAMLIAAAMTLPASICVAAESKAAAQKEAVEMPNAAKKAKRAPVRANPVDINSATRAQLKKLPGVDDALAAKIIAGRPYLSKAHLVTHHVLTMAHYTQIKDQIIARQK